MSNLGIALGGVAQGASQGLNLVNQYQQLRGEADRQQRQQQLVEGSRKLLETGMANDDPIKFAKSMRDLALEVGDPDKAFTYNQQAEALAEAKKMKLGFEAYQLAGMDPEAAVAKMNEMYQTMGATDKLVPVRDAMGNISVQGTSLGQPISKSFANIDEFKQWATEALAPSILGPKDAMMMPLEQRRVEAQIGASEANIEQSRSQTKIAEALAPVQIEAARANIAQSGASAAASRAAAAESELRRKAAEVELANQPEAIRLAREKTEQEIAESRGRTRQYDANADYIEAGKPGNKNAIQVIDELLPDPIAPGVGGPLADKAFLAPFAQAIQVEMGSTGYVAAADALNLLQVPNIDIDVGRDAARLPNGKIIKLGAGGGVKLMQARAQVAQSAADAEAE